MGISLDLSKEDFQFSCAHMTVFEDGTKERLHGHTYRVSVSVDLGGPESLGRLVDFGDLKRPIRALCRQWDEHLLLASRSPRFVLVRTSAEEIEFTLCGKRYLIPADEVLLLPINNVTAEALAHEFGTLLLKELTSIQVHSLRVHVNETSGQGATANWIIK